MKFFVNSSLYYTISGTATILCSLRCLKSASQSVSEELLTTSPDSDCVDLQVGSCDQSLTRIDVEMEGDFEIQYTAYATVDYSVATVASLKAKVIEFPHPSVIPYLYPSRYAPSDRMRHIAQDLFGHIDGRLAQAIAIEEWLYQNVTYHSGISTEQSWSLDTFESRAGVCRDFAHLGISLCRAISIPARYVTVYAHQLWPADFHAVYEVWLNDAWYVFDGTRRAPLNGMIRIANGRDAADSAVANLFGNITGQGMSVSTELSDNESEKFEALTRQSLLEQGTILKLGG